VRLRPMEGRDLVAADRLRAFAGWNQTLADWRRFLDAAPGGCFVAERGGTVVGTATTTCYGLDLAWVGMVLVHPEQRRAGIGTALLCHCLDHLRGLGARCVKLDATPMGKLVYDRLGFRDEWGLARWETGAAAAGGGGWAAGVRVMAEADWEAVERLDAAVFGVGRGHLLRPLAAGSVRVLVCDAGGVSGIDGFGMLRAGSRASYLGPVVAGSDASGLALVRALLGAAAAGPVYWDIPDDNAAAVASARGLGFGRQRDLIRMFLGVNATPGDPRRMFGILGPEMG
jgi:predicted N-acetyltransferase YhbS